MSTFNAMKILIFILIGFNFNKLIRAESLRPYPQRELENQIKALQMDNTNLHAKFELMFQKLQKLEDLFERKTFCERSNDELQNLFKQWTALLKADHQNEGTRSSFNATPKLMKTPNNSFKYYDNHFNCILNCENEKQFPETCAEALAINRTGDGIYQLKIPNTNLGVFSAYCLQDFLSENAWIVIQRRQTGGEHFMRNWTDYKFGFGDLNGDYWLGLDRIHALTQSKKYELWIQLKDQYDIGRYANYNEFAIADEDQWYKLTALGSYTGDAGNTLSYNYEAPFSTYDQDHDASPTENCADNRKGGWWFTDCKESNLNGIYNSTIYGTGINWIGWHNYNHSLKYVHIAIRPVPVESINRTQMFFLANQTVHEYE